MNKGENKPETPKIKGCPINGTVVVDYKTGVGTVIRPPCPQTSVSSVITQKPCCVDWDESKKECKWILARDAILGMTSNIVKPL